MLRNNVFSSETMAGDRFKSEDHLPFRYNLIAFAHHQFKIIIPFLTKQLLNIFIFANTGIIYEVPCLVLTTSKPV